MIAGFCLAELAGLLGTTSGSAARPIGDEPDLRHRLPLTWRRVVAAEIPGYLARKVAQARRQLSAEAAALADVEIVDRLGVLSFGRRGEDEAPSGHSPSPVDPAKARPRAVIYVHLSEEALRGGAGVARIEGVGPVLLAQLRLLLRDLVEVKLQPVIDLNDTPASVDSCEIPTGRIYLVNASGTHTLGHGVYAHALWRAAAPEPVKGTVDPAYLHYLFNLAAWRVGGVGSVTQVDDLTATRRLLQDAFDRVHEGVRDLTQGLDGAATDFRPDPEANSIAWLVWHLTRVQDDHVADLAGVGQAWPRWRDRFGLELDDPDATGYGMSAADVGRVHASGSLLASYHDDVHQLTTDYLDGLDADELERIVDDRWDPPVTAAVRLVSVFEDASMHLGQANYVKGLYERSVGA